MATRAFPYSPMQRFQHGLRMGFCDAEEGAGGAFRAAVALFPILEGARADADERGELGLTEIEFLADCLGIGRRMALPGQVRRLEGGGARRFLFTMQDGTTFFEAGAELLEKFVFHGNSFSMIRFEGFELSGGKVFLFVLRVGEQKKNDACLNMPLVDDAQPAALATT